MARGPTRPGCVRDISLSDLSFISLTLCSAWRGIMIYKPQTMRLYEKAREPPRAALPWSGLVQDCHLPHIRLPLGKRRGGWLLQPDCVGLRVFRVAVAARQHSEPQVVAVRHHGHRRLISVRRVELLHLGMLPQPGDERVPLARADGVVGAADVRPVELLVDVESSAGEGGTLLIARQRAGAGGEKVRVKVLVFGEERRDRDTRAKGDRRSLHGAHQI
mmetsp:Transcript_46914/g.152479  ORF Transcript_46914/g.152479 Transcript_46914/m.152479 type:complete len:218 (+) Transcript_46914:274-927(+)